MFFVTKQLKFQHNCNAVFLIWCKICAHSNTFRKFVIERHTPMKKNSKIAAMPTILLHPSAPPAAADAINPKIEPIAAPFPAEFPFIQPAAQQHGSTRIFVQREKKNKVEAAADAVYRSVKSVRFLHFTVFGSTLHHPSLIIIITIIEVMKWMKVFFSCRINVCSNMGEFWPKVLIWRMSHKC